MNIVLMEVHNDAEIECDDCGDSAEVIIDELFISDSMRHSFCEACFEEWRKLVSGLEIL